MVSYGNKKKPSLSIKQGRVRDKRIGILIGAHFRRFAPETGLYASIPQPLRGFRYFRFNPLRGRKTASMPFFASGFASQTPGIHHSQHPCWPGCAGKSPPMAILGFPGF
jgi:hypothetical protein